MIRKKNFEILRGRVICAPMKRVVKRLGDLEEVLSSLHHLPTNVEAQLAGEGNQPVQDLCHAAAHGRGIHHHHFAPLQWSRERADFSYLSISNERSIVVQ